MVCGHRAVHWQVVAGVGLGAEPGSDFEVDAGSAVVVDVAASGDRHAGQARRAPAVSILAHALAGLAVMVRGGRAVLRDVIAGVGDNAPSGVAPEDGALSARVGDFAAGRYLDTGALG